jgi:hypothetical protein
LREDSGLEEDSALDGADGVDEDSLIFTPETVRNTHKNKRKLKISKESDKSAVQRKNVETERLEAVAWRLEDKKLASKGLNKIFVNKMLFS